MKRGPQPLGHVLQEVIASLGIERKLDEVRAIETWAALAGPQINAVTDSARMHGGKLYVRLTSAAWRHELHLQREEWQKRINEQLGATIVQEIVFR